MKRILVLVPHEDRAERALDLATRLAPPTGAEVLAVRALEEPLRGAGEGVDAAAGERLRSLLVESEQAALEALVAPRRSPNLEIETLVRFGVPHEVVLELVADRPVDVVVKPARGISHAGGVFFGVTALHLFRKCPCPVWVVGDDGRLPGRILAAVDPGDDPVRRAMGRRVIERAARVADLAGGRFEVVSCWSAPMAAMLEGQLAKEELDAYVDDRAERARVALDDIVATAAPQIAPDRVELVEGDARTEIARIAESGGFDLIVIGTLGRDGAVSESLGETAEMVVRSVRSSVLTVSPAEVRGD
jgi:nucleotide-binding universal stress UspA family protein